MAKFIRVVPMIKTAARLELAPADYCRDCEQTSNQVPVRYNDWFTAYLCPDCESMRQEQADQTAHAFKILKSLGQL